MTGKSWGPGRPYYAHDYDYATVAYDAATGAFQWLKLYNGPGNGRDSAAAVAETPIGGRVVVTGQSLGASSDDWATLAYSAS